MDPTPSGNLQTCLTLLRNIDSIGDVPEQTSESLKIFRESFDHSLPTKGDDLDKNHIEALSISCRTLATHANDALLNNPDYFAKLLSALAVATKETPMWRELFGKSDTDHAKYAQPSNTEPDSVLEVARRVTAFSESLPSSALQSALRIIANCCANNNVNRKVIIHRDGVRLLLLLAENDVDPDALVLSLYNVCIDYDEPATYPALNSPDMANLTITDSNEDTTEANKNDEESLSLAVERLATAYSSNENCTTFELLLSLESRVSPHVRPYLAELVDMATQPALHGFEYIRSVNGEHVKPWTWSFSIGGKTYDTVALVARLTHADPENLVHMNGAVLNLLSQQAASAALSKREDDAVLVLTTLSCPLEDDLDDETDETLLQQRKAILKLLYQITGESSFHKNHERASILIDQCVTKLTMCNRRSLNSAVSEKRRLDTGSQPLIVASTLVIPAQLAVSDNVRDKLLHDGKLIEALNFLLAYERSPDILYPTVSIVSRLSLTDSKSIPPVLQTGILGGMQRLLTSQGLGMTVPVETVIAYTRIARNRPDAVNSMLTSESRNGMIVTDILTLWSLTMEGGTRLEISKFFLELFRTVFPVQQEQNSYYVVKELPVLQNFRNFLSSFASDVAEVFVWQCLKAEPTQQRDHGWFGLAMLSLWPEAKAGILSVLEARQDLRDEILRVLELQHGPVKDNLTLFVSKLADSQNIAAVTKDILQLASRKLGLTVFA